MTGWSVPIAVLLLVAHAHGAQASRGRRRSRRPPAPPPVVLTPAPVATPAQMPEPGTLSARVKDPQLRAAIVLFEDSRLPEAAAALDEVLARKDLSPSDLRDAQLGMAFSQAALGYIETATARIREICLADIDFIVPPYTSPKLKKFFETIRAEVRAEPRLSALPPLLQPSGTGVGKVHVRFKLDRPLGSMRAVVLWRVRGRSSVFAETPLASADELTAELEPPMKALSAQGDLFVDYYAELRSPAGSPAVVLASVGAINQPLSVRVQVSPQVLHAEAGSPLYKKWWLWTAVSVVVVGAAAGGVSYYLLTREPAPANVTVNFSGAR